MAADIRARISLDSSQFTAGIGKAMSALGAITGKIAGVSAKIAGAFAVLGAPISLGGLVVGAKDALEFGDKMDELSSRTGVAVRDLVILGQAFNNVGIGADGVGPAINKMQKALVGVNEDGEPTNKTFKQLGLDMAALRAMSPAQQFEAVSKAISGLASPAERTAAAMSIFGRTGGEMLALFRDTAAIETATRQVGAQADVLQRNAAVMGAVSDAFASIKSTLRGFFVGMVEPLLPLLSQIAVWLNSIGSKAVEFGKKLGESISSAVNILVNAWKTDQLGTLIGLALKIGFGEAVNYLAGALLSAVDALAAALGATFRRLFSVENFKASFQMFLAIPEIIIGGIISGMGKLGVAIAAALQWALAQMTNALPSKLRRWLTGSAEQDTRTFSDFMTASAEGGPAASVGDFGDRLVADALERFGKVGANAFDVAKVALNAFMGEWKKFSPAQIFDTAQWKDTLAKLAAELNVPVATLQQAAEEAAPSIAALGDVAKNDNVKPMASDRADVDQFTRLGLFSGNSAGIVNHMQRTAENTTKMLAQLTGGIRITALPPIVATAG